MFSGEGFPNRVEGEQNHDRRSLTKGRMKINRNCGGNYERRQISFHDLAVSL